MRRPPKPPPPSLIRRGPCRHTLFIRDNTDVRAPQELWDLICKGSNVVLVEEAPDEGFSLFMDRVVIWNDPDVTIDGAVFQWPRDAQEVIQLFQRL